MRLTLALMLLTGCVYAGDYLVVRWRLAQHRNPFDVMEMQRLLAVRLQGKRTEFMLEGPQVLVNANVVEILVSAA